MVPGEFPQLVNAVIQIGLTGTLVLFLVFEGRQREKAQQQSYERLVERLISLVESTNRIIVENTEAVRTLERSINNAADFPHTQKRG